MSKNSSAESLRESKLQTNAFVLILLLSFLIFFAQTRSFQLLFDGLTYSAIAKNILKTGDWKTLHYGLEQYSVFYQHPPLAMWIQALFYKVLGWSEPMSRVFPSLCGVLTVVSVFIFSRARFGLTAAFCASIALITSTRFIKWGSNFYLDGILSFFCFASFSHWLWVLSEHKNSSKKKAAFISFISGVLLASALMTKGVIAGSMVGLSFFSALLFFSRRTILLSLFFLAGLAAPLLLWIQIGNGLEFIQNYLALSLANRVQIHEWSIHPWRNIYKLWWPWWPIFVVSLWTSFRPARPDFGCGECTWKISLCLILAALSFPIGFSFGVGYLEHYLTPFYPFASILVGVQIARWIQPIGERTVKWGYALVFGVAIFLATVAPNVNQQKEITATHWIQELRTLPKSSQTRIQQIVFTEKSAELWITLATLLGRTDWQAIGNYALDRTAKEHSVLISKQGEMVSPTWERMPCLFVQGSEFYSPKGESFCP